MSRPLGPVAPDIIKLLMHGPHKIQQMEEILDHDYKRIYEWLSNFEKSGVVRQLPGNKWALCDMPFSESYRKGPLT